MVHLAHVTVMTYKPFQQPGHPAQPGEALLAEDRRRRGPSPGLKLGHLRQPWPLGHHVVLPPATTSQPPLPASQPGAGTAKWGKSGRGTAPSPDTGASLHYFQPSLNSFVKTTACEGAALPWENRSLVQQVGTDQSVCFRPRLKGEVCKSSWCVSPTHVYIECSNQIGHQEKIEVTLCRGHPEHSLAGRPPGLGAPLSLGLGGGRGVSPLPRKPLGELQGSAPTRTCGGVI